MQNYYCTDCLDCNCYLVDVQSLGYSNDWKKKVVVLVVVLIVTSNYYLLEEVVERTVSPMKMAEVEAVAMT